MRILLTGATGYIGKRMISVLLQQGHSVICCVRDKSRFDTSVFEGYDLEVTEVDFLKRETLEKLPADKINADQ